MDTEGWSGVLRLEPRGEQLFAQLSGGDRHGWHRRVGDAWLPCDPAHDPKVPLARALPELRARGEVELLAYRPERRIVVRVRGRDGARVLKGTRPRRLERMRGRHEHAAALLEGGPMRVARLLDVDEAHAALVLADEPGRRLRLSPDQAEMFVRIGAGLRVLQAEDAEDAEPHDAESLDVHDADAELKVIDDLAARADGLGRGLAPGWMELSDAVHRVRVELPEVTLRPAHRDLHDGQFVVSSRELVLLDLDLLCRADPLLDAANLIAHLKLRELQGLRGADERSVAVCGARLLEALDHGAQPGYRLRLRWYQAATFMRLALVYRLRPRWEHLERELLDRARRCLDDR